MKTVYKYLMSPSGEIAMPLGAEVVSCQLQKSALCLWAIVDPDAPETARQFGIFGTGHPLPEQKIKYIDTFQDGPFVLHVFEYIEGATQ